jgi:hypothetical protein
MVVCRAVCLFLLWGSYVARVLGDKEDASCPPGTYMDPSGRCSWCREGTYQDRAGSRSCKECKLGTVSKEIAATSPMVCKNCPIGTFAASTSLCLQCPTNTISPAGATNSKECTALAGFYGLPGKPAAECPQNHYCVQGTFVPIPCPEGMISDTMATSCVPGVQHVVVNDWIFSLVWVALFLSGAIWLGAYKMVKTCLHNRWTIASGNRVIQIRILPVKTLTNKSEGV